MNTFRIRRDAFCAAETSIASPIPAPRPDSSAPAPPEPYRSQTLPQILRMYQLDPFEMCRQHHPQGFRQHRHPVLVTLATMHDDLIPLKINVLDAQPQQLHQPQPRPIKQLHRQLMLHRHRRQQPFHLAGINTSGSRAGRRTRSKAATLCSTMQNLPIQKHQRIYPVRYCRKRPLI